MRKYINGWEGLTKIKWEKMNNVCSAQLSVWTTVFKGDEFLPDETLRANGLHPDKIPIVFKNCHKIGEIIEKISKNIPLTFVTIPDN